MVGYTLLTEKDATVLQKNRSKLAAGSGLAILLITALLWHHGPPPHHGAGFAYSTSSSTPYDQPGYLSFSDDKPLESNWIPFTCTPTPNWLSLIRTALDYAIPDAPGQPARLPNDGLSPRKREQLREEALQDLQHLRNTTILLIGDSVDRNLVDFTADNTASRDHLRVALYEDINTPGLDDRGIPHVLQLPAPMDLTIANCFFYGLDDHDEFSVQPDWFAPGLAEDRMKRLCKPFTDQLPYPPSMIQLHSGLWDLAYFGRMDKRSSDPSRRHANRPLTSEQMKWWQKRMNALIKNVKRTWPGVPILIRGLHRVSSPDSVVMWTPDEDPDGFVNFFADNRVAQIRAMQEVIALENGLAFFDWGHVWEGFQVYQDKVHPWNLPGGVVMGNALLHHAYLFAEEAARSQASERLPDR